jgi:phosphotransferase system enzyme I (PtsI)
MEELAGISASPGITIGQVFLYGNDRPPIPRYEVATEELAREVERFRHAVSSAKTELNDLKQQTSEGGSREESRFLDSHLLMLTDEEFLKSIEERLHDQQINVEWVLEKVIADLVGKLDNSGDTYLSERRADLHDIATRLLNHLMPRQKTSLADLEEEVIIVAHDLLPSDTIAMNKRMVKGIVMDAGGRTSHTAILARSFEIPAVLGLSQITQRVATGDRIIVDGNRGRVIVHPDEKAEQRYERIEREWRKREVQLMGLNELPAETKDGKLITLGANIEVPEEVDAISSHGGDGVGLFRSEFLFLRPGQAAPSEEEQFQAYKQVLESMEDKPVTIRTLDVGGDKVAPDIEGLSEKNPILGWRAIRFCLSRKDLFVSQLRALLRASIYGQLRIMFPMISGIEELTRVYEVLDEVKDQLRQEEVRFDPDVPVGIMVEVPSAAMTSDVLARKVDFFSIGTNDLIQYTIAVDRGNEKIAYLYEPFHPGVLRMLRMIIENGHAAGIPVGMCGEMAGDPMATLILLGLGLDEFSMSASSIPEVKRIIRDVSMAEAEELVGTVLDMKSYRKIDSFVQDLMEKRFEIKVY